METSENSRRDFLRKSGLLALAGVGAQLLNSSVINAANSVMADGAGVSEFTLPVLPYSYDALEPHIDKLTMEIHRDKHHQAYVTNLNKAVKEGNIGGSLEEIISVVSKYTPAVRNNAGGHWNHSFFWKLMKPGGGGAPDGKVADAIRSAFGSFDDFKTKFNDAGMKRFGSGWAWLVLNPAGKLEIGSTQNQDNPLMDVSELKGKPIMGIDVWEHAYYLKYQNKRADYVSSWWNTLNWAEINSNLSAAEKKK